MSTPEKKLREGAFALPLKLIGFTKRGGTWHRVRNAGVQVINIQGSQWSRIFYRNLGVYFPEVGKKDLPAEYDCHIRRRLDQLVPDRAQLAYLLDLHTKRFVEADGSEQILLVMKYGAPWLDRCSDKMGFLEEAQSKGALVHFEVKSLVAAVVAQQTVQPEGPASGGSAG